MDKKKSKLTLVMGERKAWWCVICGGKCPDDCYDDETGEFLCNSCHKCGSYVCFNCFDPKTFPEKDIENVYLNVICPNCTDTIDDDKLVYAEDVLERAQAKRAKREEEEK